jgi:hypothetical protein
MASYLSSTCLIMHTTHTGIIVTNDLNVILRYTAYDATRESVRTSSQDTEQRKEMRGMEERRYRYNCRTSERNARREAQPEHMTHASLFSSEHASFASSSSRACFRSRAAANSGSFSAARRCASSSPAKLSACESAGVRGSTGDATGQRTRQRG